MSNDQDQIYINPVQRLRQMQINQAKTERDELMAAYRDGIAPDIHLTELQRDEFEKNVSSNDRWLDQNYARIEALLPRVLSSLIEYERVRDLHRGQIDQVLREASAVSVNLLWGSRRDGLRDPGAFTSTIANVKIRLGQSRGAAGAIHRAFLRVELELIANERAGLGLPPEPPPLAQAPEGTTNNAKRQIRRAATV